MVTTITRTEGARKNDRSLSCATVSRQTDDRVAPDVPHRGQPHQHHRDVELVADDLDRFGHPRLTRGPQTVNESASDQAGAGAESEGAQDVLTAADPAVEKHLDLRADGIGDLREHGDRRWSAVELATAMIRNDDRRGSGLRRDLRILDVEDPFEDELPGPKAAHPLDVLPVERGIELF